MLANLKNDTLLNLMAQLKKLKIFNPARELCSSLFSLSVLVLLLCKHILLYLALWLISWAFCILLLIRLNLIFLCLESCAFQAGLEQHAYTQVCDSCFANA